VCSLSRREEVRDLPVNVFDAADSFGLLIIRQVERLDDFSTPSKILAKVARDFATVTKESIARL
tara:strand:+ start:35961 stop:36152 length:192 start_codon:yes stop_codon:yes gene_type:complete